MSATRWRRSHIDESCDTAEIESEAFTDANCSNPLLHPPPRRGGGKRWELERLELSEAIEWFERLVWGRR